MNQNTQGRTQPHFLQDLRNLENFDLLESSVMTSRDVNYHPWTLLIPREVVRSTLLQVLLSTAGDVMCCPGGECFAPLLHLQDGVPQVHNCLATVMVDDETYMSPELTQDHSGDV